MLNQFGYSTSLADTSEYLKLPSVPDGMPVTAFTSLKYGGNITFAFGTECESYQLIQRSDRWSVSRLEKDRLSANFQGNPLWPFKILSPYKNLLEYFGLHLLSSTTTACLIPDCKTINSKLVKLNSRFGFKDSTSYTKTNMQITDKIYVDTFIDQRKLPMAPLSERDGVHDWSYHFLTFLFDEYLENVRINLLFIRNNLFRFSGTTSYPWNYYGHTTNDNGKFVGTPVFEDLPYEQALYRQMAISLDVCTAKMIQLLSFQQSGQFEKVNADKMSCEIFFNGITTESIDWILPFEKMSKMGLPMPIASRNHIASSCISYCENKLRDLDRAAIYLLNKDQIEYRKSAFAKILEGI